MTTPRTPSTPTVEVTAVTRTFGRGTMALDRVCLRVEEPSIVGLLGRNGAGKSTLLSILGGGDRATSGTVRVLGADPWEDEGTLSRICTVREAQRYPNNFTLRHVLECGRAFHPAWDAEAAYRLVDRLELPLGRQVEKMSRGMRAGVGIVVGLASRAPVTLLDEPTLGLDAGSRQLFYDLLIAEQADHPRTFVLSTHLIDEVAPLLEQVVVLDAGRVVMAGDADALARRGCTLTGPAAVIEEMTAGWPMLSGSALGSYLSATFDVPFEPAVVDLAHERGLEATPISLQTLVVQAARGPVATGAAR
jgi:ABC-2 type transport system ATP-binding protein